MRFRVSVAHQVKNFPGQVDVEVPDDSASPEADAIQLGLAKVQAEWFVGDPNYDPAEWIATAVARS